MQILTNYETLKRLERGVPDISIRLEKAKILYGKTVFLSHATADDDLVPGVLVLLDSHGGRVYVDHHDPSLPDSDCIEIAQHLRTVVRNCGKLVVLASPKSKESKWIPWELGLGDGMLPQRNVALFRLPSLRRIWNGRSESTLVYIRESFWVPSKAKIGLSGWYGTFARALGGS
jgi:TIR domain